MTKMDIILSFLAKPLDKHGTIPVHIMYPSGGGGGGGGGGW